MWSVRGKGRGGNYNKMFVCLVLFGFVLIDNSLKDHKKAIFANVK